MVTALKRIMIFAVLLVSAGAAAYAEDMRFAALDVDTGAKAVAMGSAQTALADDSSAIYWNPAGLADIKMPELNLSYNAWMLYSSFQNVSGALPLGYGTLAAGFTYFDFGSFDEYDETGVDLGGGIRAYNISASLGYGFPVTDFMSAGLNIKFSGLTVDTDTIAGALLDAGLLIKAGDMFSLGFSARNVDLGNELVPGSLTLGLGLKIPEMGFLGLKAGLDTKYSFASKIMVSAGIEFMFSKMIALRAGYRYRNENSATGGLSGMTAGLGVVVDKFGFDYAFTSLGDLGMTHLVNLRLTMEDQEKRQQQNYEKMTQFLAYQYFRDGQDMYDAGDFSGALTQWRIVKDMDPLYAGIDEAIQKAGRLKQGAGAYKKAQEMFDAGMKAYEKADFEMAAMKWGEVKKSYPDFKDIDVWLEDALELKASKGMAKKAEKDFMEGMRRYNVCDYAGALKSWETGLEKDPGNRKIMQYIERTRAKKQEIQDGIVKAKADVTKDATVIEGIKRLRSISTVCPAYKDAIDILATLKDLIVMKTRDNYFKGIEKYTDGNLDAAIVYWKNIEALDPKSEYISKVKRYIEDARSKQKALEKLKKK